MSRRWSEVVSRARSGAPWARRLAAWPARLGRLAWLAWLAAAPLGVAALASQTACGARGGAATSSASASASTAPGGASVAASRASAGLVAADDPAVLEAASLEPEALRALVGARTAEELVAVVRRGGPGRAIALAALPLASDAELALEPLTSLAAGDPDKRGLMAAAQAIAAALGRDTEPLDLEGRRRAHAALEALARDRSLDAEARALAHAAARELAARGAGTASEPPPDLL